MIRKGIIAVLALLAVGTGVAWVCRPSSFALVDMQETQGGRRESHWVSFLDSTSLHISYGPYTWRTQPRQYFSPPFAGFGYAHHSTLHQEYREVKIPYWALLLLFAAYPATAFIRGPMRRWRRRRRGLCLTCAYDLTGNESGTCPECGATVPA